MGSRRDAASVIFNLPGYRVVDAVDLPLGGRRVRVQPVDLADGCPSCGVISARVHAWIVQRVRDIPHAGQLEVMVRKPRLVCAEPKCPRGTFTPATEQLPVRARCTTRLRTALLSAVINSGRAVAEVAADHGVAWWTVQSTVNAAAVLLPNVDELHMRRLGIDEHRYRRVRWFRDPDGGGWRRVEPWMSTIVNADCGQVLGIVDGRDSAAVGGWLSERSRVRQRLVREREQRRGRAGRGEAEPVLVVVIRRLSTASLCPAGLRPSTGKSLSHGERDVDRGRLRKRVMHGAAPRDGEKRRQPLGRHRVGWGHGDDDLPDPSGSILSHTPCHLDCEASTGDAVAIKEPSGVERDAQSEAGDEEFGWCGSSVVTALVQRLVDAYLVPPNIDCILVAADRGHSHCIHALPLSGPTRIRPASGGFI